MTGIEDVHSGNSAYAFEFEYNPRAQKTIKTDIRTKHYLYRFYLRRRCYRKGDRKSSPTNKKCNNAQKHKPKAYPHYNTEQSAPTIYIYIYKIHLNTRDPTRRTCDGLHHISEASPLFFLKIMFCKKRHKTYFFKNTVKKTLIF